MVTLMTQWYRSPNSERNAEIDACIEANLNNARITRIIWFVPENQQSLMPELEGEIITVPERMHFADAFDIDAEDDELMIVANSDIILTEDTIHEIEKTLQADEVYCLSRWNVSNVTPQGLAAARLYNVGYSQDTWCWRGKVDVPAAKEIPLGVWGCDNRICYELSRIRKATNPAQRVKTYHYHVSNFRTTPPSMKVPPPYLNINTSF